MTLIIDIENKYPNQGPEPDIIAWDFPSGAEFGIRLTKIRNQKYVIFARLSSSNAVMRLLLITDAVRRAGGEIEEVIIPYFPYARQDRVMVPGEPLSIKVMADLINGQSYPKVTVFDAHSDVLYAILNNANIVSNLPLVFNALKDKDELYFVSPDLGASKKVYTLANKWLGLSEKKPVVVECAKTRDPATGSIAGQEIHYKGDLEGKEVSIIDDICDGGRTFVGLAKKLKEERKVSKVNLIVSHGIFSNGFNELIPLIDHIYTTDSFRDVSSPFVTQYKVKEILL